MATDRRQHEQRWKHDEPGYQRAAATLDRPIPKGPWDDEPDKVQWVDGATGLDCLAVRNQLGNWCGYVGVPDDHPLHGKGYGGVDVSVHGGLTFADGCDDEAPEGHGICHIPLPGRPDNVWWLGFDCGHFNDLTPALIGAYGGLEALSGDSWLKPVYRDLEFVQRECESLAEQLAEVR